MNKIVSTMLVVTLVIATITGIFEDTMSYAVSDALYMTVGLMLYISGIWAAIILYRLK